MKNSLSAMDSKRGVRHYRGLQEGAGHFTFYSNRDQLPELNGVPIALKPD